MSNDGFSCTHIGFMPHTDISVASNTECPALGIEMRFGLAMVRIPPDIAKDLQKALTEHADRMQKAG